MRVPLVDSPYLDALPELNGVDASAVYLAPGDFATWAAAFAAHPAALDYILDADDFESWGTMLIPASMDGAIERRRTVRGQAGTRLALWDVQGDHWILSQIEVHGATSNCSVYQSTNTVIDRCTYLDSDASAYGFRVRSCHDVTVQRCLLGNFGPTGSDITGVQIRPINSSYPVSNCRVLDCEIYSAGDCIQVTQAADDPTTVVSYIIDGNDLYTAQGYAGGVENGIDIKAGDSAIRSYITNNRIWGYPGGLASRGDGIVMHKEARNCEVSGNIVGESFNGIWVQIWDDNHLGSRFIDWTDNLVYGCTSAFDPNNDCTLVDNIAVNCQVLFDYSPARVNTPTVTGTKVRRVELTHYVDDTAPCPYDPELNNLPTDTTITYERKRWTGPEWKTVFAGSTGIKTGLNPRR